MALVSRDSESQRRRAAASGNGSEGGLKRAEYYGPEVLSEWAASGGKAVLAKYGREYLVALRKRRRTSADTKRQERADHEICELKTRATTAWRNGQRGGLARAASYSAEQRSEWARKGGIATRARYGNDFYRKIRTLRKTYRKGYLTRKTKHRLREAFKQISSVGMEDPHVASLWKFLAKSEPALHPKLGWQFKKD